MAVEFEAERVCSQLVGDGSAVRLSCVLHIDHHGAPARTRTVVAAQRSIPAAQGLKLSEAQHIVENTVLGVLHKDYVCAAGSQFLITTVREASFYGKNTNTVEGGGIVVIRLPASILVVLFTGAAPAQRVVPVVERAARQFHPGQSGKAPVG